MVADVLRADEIAPGPAPQDLADLHVVWQRHRPPAGGVVATSRRGAGRHPAAPPGNHVEGGWFVAAGPGIRHGAVDAAVSTLDFAPTVTRLVGGHVDGDGSPIAGVYSEV